MRYAGSMPYFQLTPVRKPINEKKVKQISATRVTLIVVANRGIPMKFHCQNNWNEQDDWANEFIIDATYIIIAATYWSGKFADIINVEGDVLPYISLLQNGDMVVKYSKIIKVLIP